MNLLETCICVWDPKTDTMLFEGSSAAIGLEDIRSVIGPDAFPGDPDIIAVQPITRDQGSRLIEMMGLRFEGDGEFQISREIADA